MFDESYSQFVYSRSSLETAEATLWENLINFDPAVNLCSTFAIKRLADTQKVELIHSPLDLRAANESITLQ